MKDSERDKWFTLGGVSSQEYTALDLRDKAGIAFAAGRKLEAEWLIKLADEYQRKASIARDEYEKKYKPREKPRK